MRLPGTGDGHGDAVLIRNPSPTRGEGKRGVRGRTFFDEVIYSVRYDASDDR